MNKDEQPDFSIHKTLNLFFMFVVFELFMPHSLEKFVFEK